jgi:hypothetical protein
MLTAECRFSCSLLKPIQHGEQGYRQDCIGDGGPQFVRPAPLQGKSHQPASHHEVKKLVDHVEEYGYQEAGACVFHIELHAERGCSVADNGFCDAEKSDRIVRQGILRNADEGTSDQSRDGAATSDSKKYHHQERKVKNCKEGKVKRNECLQKYRKQGYEDRNRKAEPVDLDLLLRCVCNRHAIEAGRAVARAWFVRRVGPVPPRDRPTE